MRLERLAAAALLVVACVCGTAGHAGALDRAAWIDPPQDPRCADAFDMPCKGPELVPCGRMMIPERPCRPVKPCWIEPWLCREDNGPDPRIR